MLWQPGLILNNTYRIDRQFDGGSVGVVYQATDLKQDRTVAIKTLNPTQTSGDRFQQKQVKFINEAMKLAKLQHRHIVEVFEVVESDGLFGMVMEFVKGENLAECLQQQGQPFCEPIALGYIQQIGEALVVLHDRGMLHRDVKPLNIMRRAANPAEAVLIDFGLARELEFGVTQSFTNVGTPAYAAPEQFHQQREARVKPGAYTDVYGLAATLYALLTNQNPFPAEFRLQGAALIPPYQQNRAVSQRVSQAIVRGMALDPLARSATVAEFLADLGLGVRQPASPKTTARFPLQRFRANTVELDRRGNITQRRTIHPEYFTEQINGIGIDMVSIAEGRFVPESLTSEADRNDRESPQPHHVSLPAFFMSRFAVTQAQWRAVAQLPTVKENLDPDPANFKGDQRPVEQVSWDDAQEFCRRLSQATGKAYQLPSEAAWEYACRAGSTTPFAFGATLSTDLANYDGNYVYADGRQGLRRQRTTPVGTFVPNAWGLYDMHGNIWEWCEDSWHGGYNDAPVDDSACLDSASEFKILHGGSWNDIPWSCRSANRYYFSRGLRLNLIGFRLFLPNA
jgi:formylglycine-generating enzyme required for sulfatase activity